MFKQHMYGGPKGLGDPTYRELSKMEEDPMIPQRMRDITRTQLCIPEVRAFSECSKNSGFSMVFQCQAEKNCMVECQRQWMEDRPEFRAAVKAVFSTLIGRGPTGFALIGWIFIIVLLRQHSYAIIATKAPKAQK